MSNDKALLQDFIGAEIASHLEGRAAILIDRPPPSDPPIAAACAEPLKTTPAPA